MIGPCQEQDAGGGGGGGVKEGGGPPLGVLCEAQRRQTRLWQKPGGRISPYLPGAQSDHRARDRASGLNATEAKARPEKEGVAVLQRGDPGRLPGGRLRVAESSPLPDTLPSSQQFTSQIVNEIHDVV